MPGRPRVYDDVQRLASKESVRAFLRKVEESNRKASLYTVARYLRWRRSAGLGADPDLMMDECTNGTNRALADHL